MLDLLFSDSRLLDQGQHGHQKEEDDGLGLCDAVVFFVDVIGGIDVQGQQLRNVDLCAILDDAGQTASQREVLVEEGMTFGMMTFVSVCQPLAPSIFAASSISSDTACNPAM